MATPYTWQLKANAIYSLIRNMVISQENFADNVKGTYSGLVEKARVDGTLFGDTKLYYASDCLKSYEWDPTDTNILEQVRAESPKVQSITLDKFRQIALTTDAYLTKQAWSTPEAFSSFNSVMLGWIRDTKRIYDSTTYNAFIGTMVSPAAMSTDFTTQNVKITPIAGQNDALTMAEGLADLLVKVKDVSRDFNDYGFIRSYDESDLVVVWNAKIYNTLKKIDMPVIFHKDGLLNEFTQEVLPAKYFGNIVGTEANEFTIPAEGTQTYRTLVEIDLSEQGGPHLFPGEEIPEGYKVLENETYTEDNSIAFKVMHKRSVPYMSAFEVSTSFFNPKNLSENNYLTFGHNTLEYLRNYPCITAKFGE